MNLQSEIVLNKGFNADHLTNVDNLPFLPLIVLATHGETHSRAGQSKVIFEG
jgi:hypothetical protein